MSGLLVEAISRYTERQVGVSPFLTAIGGVTILRSDHEKPAAHMIIKPALCIVVQGAKWTSFGDNRFEYGAGQALVVCVEVPSVGRVVEASPNEPYLGIIIEFDQATIREVWEALGTPQQESEDTRRGVFVTHFDGALSDCVLRIVRLLDTPDAIPTLFPMIMREIAYWLLTGPHGGEVAKMTLANTHTHRMVSAIHNLRDRFSEPIRIEQLARLGSVPINLRA